MIENWRALVKHDCGVADLVEIETLPFSVAADADSYDTMVLIAVCRLCGAVLFIEVGDRQPYTGRSGLEDSNFLRYLKSEVDRLTKQSKPRGNGH